MYFIHAGEVASHLTPSLSASVTGDQSRRVKVEVSPLCARALSFAVGY